MLINRNNQNKENGYRFGVLNGNHVEERFAVDKINANIEAKVGDMYTTTMKSHYNSNARKYNNNCNCQLNCYSNSNCNDLKNKSYNSQNYGSQYHDLILKNYLNYDDSHLNNLKPENNPTNNNKELFQNNKNKAENFNLIFGHGLSTTDVI